MIPVARQFHVIYFASVKCVKSAPAGLKLSLQLKTANAISELTKLFLKCDSKKFSDSINSANSFIRPRSSAVILLHYVAVK